MTYEEKKKEFLKLAVELLMEDPQQRNAVAFSAETSFVKVSVAIISEVKL